MSHVGDLYETPKQKSSNGDPHESWSRSFLTGVSPQPYLLKNTVGFKLEERSHQSPVAFDLATEIMLRGHSIDVSQSKIQFQTPTYRKINPRAHQQHLLIFSPSFLQLLPLNFFLPFSQIFFQNFSSLLYATQL